MAVFSAVSMVVLWLTFKDFRKKTRSRWVDFLIMFSTGLVGMILLFLWLLTDHRAAAYNLDLLWAFAPNTVMAFVALRRQPSTYLKGYGAMLLSLLLLLLLVWVVRVHLFSMAFVPVFFMLAIRYFFFWRWGHRY